MKIFWISPRKFFQMQFSLKCVGGNIFLTSKSKSASNAASNDVSDYVIHIEFANVPYISYIFTPTQIRIVGETWTNSIWIKQSYTSLDGEFDAYFDFEVKKIFPPTHLREKRVLKNLRGRNQKILRDLNPA